MTYRNIRRRAGRLNQLNRLADRRRAINRIEDQLREHILQIDRDSVRALQEQAERECDVQLAKLCRRWLLLQTEA